MVLLILYAISPEEPHHHPNQHTEYEIKLINDMRKRNMHEGLVVFWVKLMQRGYSRSTPFTPRHNGKVERSHRKDNERFYAVRTFYSFDDFSKQLSIYNRRDYNNFPMRPLLWRSPKKGGDVFLVYLCNICLTNQQHHKSLELTYSNTYNFLK